MSLDFSQFIFFFPSFKPLGPSLSLYSKPRSYYLLQPSAVRNTCTHVLTCGSSRSHLEDNDTTHRMSIIICVCVDASMCHHPRYATPSKQLVDPRFKTYLLTGMTRHVLFHATTHCARLPPRFKVVSNTTTFPCRIESSLHATPFEQS